MVPKRLCTMHTVDQDHTSGYIWDQMPTNVFPLPPNSIISSYFCSVQGSNHSLICCLQFLWLCDPYILSISPISELLLPQCDYKNRFRFFLRDHIYSDLFRILDMKQTSFPSTTESCNFHHSYIFWFSSELFTIFIPFAQSQ